MRRKAIVSGEADTGRRERAGGESPFIAESLRVRAAEPHDGPVVYAFIKELARYEGLSDRLTATEADISGALFGSGLLRASVAWVETETRSGNEPRSRVEAPAGFILYYANFSTFRGRAGMYVEDVFVEERFRGHGIAHALFRAVAEEARRSGAFCLQWSVLDWNERAKRFYRSIGAAPLGGWELWRMEF
jgi:GNAT superfamily N-acetyltransferase